MERKYVKPITALKKDPGFKPFEGGVAKYSVAFDLEGKIINRVHTNIYCHAGLHDPRHQYTKDAIPNKAVPIAVFNSICRIGVDEKIALRYLEWLQNFSPWAEVWHTKSARVTLKQGIMVANTDVPANLLAGAMFASRSMWEYSKIAQTWDAFVTKGLHPDLAYYLSHIMRISGQNMVIARESGHVALDGINCLPEHIVNFITRNRNDTDSYRKLGTYSSVHATWKNNRKDVTIQFNPDNLLQEVGRKDGVKVNPFKIEAAKRVSVGEAVEYLVPKYRELFKKWI